MMAVEKEPEPGVGAISTLLQITSLYATDYRAFILESMFLSQRQIFPLLARLKNKNEEKLRENSTHSQHHPSVIDYTGCNSLADAMKISTYYWHQLLLHCHCLFSVPLLPLSPLGHSHSIALHWKCIHQAPQIASMPTVQWREMSSFLVIFPVERN